MDLRQQTKHHVKAAKKWLHAAEQSFDQENVIKGDLNLMLAQAELKHAQEIKPPTEVLKLVLSIGMLACIVMYMAFSGLNNNGQPVQAPAISPRQERNVIESHSPAADVVKQFAPEQERPSVQSVPSGGTVVEREQDPAERLERTEHERKISPVQMQQLIRAAGKSLRGEN